jgi:dUTP pyrophosphatase
MKFLIVPQCEAAKELYLNHSTYHEGDSGLDLFIVEDGVIPARSNCLVDLGISCQLKSESGGNARYFSYNVYARSSISKTPLILANGVGLADAGYLGNLKAAFYNTSDSDYVIKKGERYVQLARADLGEISFELVDSFGDRTSSRGTNGLGSTSK